MSQTRQGYGRSLFEPKWPTIGYSRNRLDSDTSKNHRHTFNNGKSKARFDEVRVGKTTSITTRLDSVIHHTTDRNPMNMDSKPHFVHGVTPTFHRIGTITEPNESEPSKSDRSFGAVISTPIPHTSKFTTVKPRYTSATKTSEATSSEKRITTTMKRIDRVHNNYVSPTTAITSSVAIMTTERWTRVESKTNDDNSNEMRAMESITAPTVRSRLDATTTVTPSTTKSMYPHIIENRIEPFVGDQGTTTTRSFFDDIQTTEHTNIDKVVIDIGTDYSTSITVPSTTIVPSEATTATDLLSTIMPETMRPIEMNIVPFTESGGNSLSTPVTTEYQSFGDFTKATDEFAFTTDHGLYLDRQINTSTATYPSNTIQAIDKSNMDDAMDAFEQDSSMSSTSIAPTTIDSIDTTVPESMPANVYSNRSQIVSAAMNTIVINATTPLTESVENVSSTPPITLVPKIQDSYIDDEPKISIPVMEIQTKENRNMDEATDDTDIELTTSMRTTTANQANTNILTTNSTMAREAFIESDKEPDVDDSDTTLASQYSTTESYLTSTLTIEDMSSTWIPVPATTEGPDNIRLRSQRIPNSLITPNNEPSQRFPPLSATSTNIPFEFDDITDETFRWTSNVITSTPRPVNFEVTPQTYPTVDHTNAAIVTTTTTNFNATASDNVTSTPDIQQSTLALQTAWTHDAATNKYDPFDYELSGIPAIQAA